MCNTTLRSTTKVLPEHARAHHRSMVLQRLFHDGPTSRADLARATGLTRVTVSDLVTALLDDGLVAEIGPRADGSGRQAGHPRGRCGAQDAPGRRGGPHRRRTPARRGARSRTVTSSSAGARSQPAAGPGHAAVEAVAELCRELVAIATRPVLGIGVASPGVVDEYGARDPGAEPRLARPPARRAAQPRSSGCRCTSPTTPTPPASGELTYGGADGTGVLVLTVGQGVGAGIVLDGALVRGAGHAAGEIGHVTARRRTRRRARPGRRTRSPARAGAPAAWRPCCRCRRCAAALPARTPRTRWPRSAGDWASCSRPWSAPSTLPRWSCPAPRSCWTVRCASLRSRPSQSRTMPVISQRPAPADDGTRRGRSVARCSRARPVRSARGHLTPSRPNQRVGERDPSGGAASTVPHQEGTRRENRTDCGARPRRPDGLDGLLVRLSRAGRLEQRHRQRLSRWRSDHPVGRRW